MNELADRVRQERLGRHWSVREAARRGEISNTWWQRFEDYLQPLTESIIEAVAKAFDWSEDWTDTADGGRLSRVEAAVESLQHQIQELTETFEAATAAIEAVKKQAGEAPPASVEAERKRNQRRPARRSG